LVGWLVHHISSISHSTFYDSPIYSNELHQQKRHPHPNTNPKAAMAARTIIMLMLLLALASFIPFNMHINKTQTELKNRKQKWGAQCSHYELYPSHGCRRPSVPVVVGKLYKFCTEWLGGILGGICPDI